MIDFLTSIQPIKSYYFKNATPKIYKGNNNNYCKFIIIGHPRTGSTLLTTSLRKHINIMCFGEIYHRLKTIFRVNGYNNNSKTLFSLRNKYPVEFLNKVIWTNYNNQINAVGFKIFMPQIKLLNNNFFNYITSNKSIHIIHLTRRNVFDVYYSLIKAKKSQVYGLAANEKFNDFDIKININSFIEYAKNYEYENELIKSQFSYHPFLKIEYEDIVNDFNSEISKISNLLKVEYTELPIETAKIESRSYQEKIINYEELKNGLKNTKYLNLLN